jgi:hypothetical protein
MPFASTTRDRTCPRAIAPLLLAVALTACPPERKSPAAEAESSTRGSASSRPRRGLPDAARCDQLKLEYELSRLGSDRCERDDECSLELRGGLYTGLDGCLRMSRRGFDAAPSDRIAERWLTSGCASTLCPPLRSSAACRGGVCREKPPPPIAEDWRRVDVQEKLTLFLPPEIVEAPRASFCGNGPAVRAFHGPGLDVRVEYGYELGYLPLSDERQLEEPLPFRAVARRKKTIGPYEATVLSFQAPDVNSKATAPDGSWPRYRLVRALSVENIEALPQTGLLGVGVGTGPVALAVWIEGERARDDVAERIFDTVAFW